MSGVQTGATGPVWTGPDVPAEGTALVVPLRDVDQFCRDIHPRLVGSLRLYLGDPELAAELAQEALVRVIERWRAVAVMSHPEAWAYRVAFNLARSRLRRLGAERRAHVRTGPPPPPTEHEGDLAAAIAVRRAVALLPPRQRQAVVLRYYGGLPLAEVAEAMRCRPGTVKAHLHQALAGLRLAGLADDDDEVAVDRPPSPPPSNPYAPRPEEMP